jgi:ABC-type lipoprotein export system ATPase subunit
MSISSATSLNGEPILSLTGLEHHLGGSKGSQPFILQVDNFQVCPGEFITVFGPTGIGKTNLLKILSLVKKPTRTKKFTFCQPGNPPRLHDLQQLWQHQPAALETLRRRFMGYAPQRPQLLTSLTVRENVAVPLWLNGFGGIKARVDQLLDALGRALPQGGTDLGHISHHRPQGMISGGQEQRVGLARALANRPALLLADEPTANVNGEVARQVFQFLDALRRRHGLAIVLVSHDQRLASEFATRILWMDKTNNNSGGRIAKEKINVPYFDPGPTTSTDKTPCRPAPRPAGQDLQFPEIQNQP